MADLYLCRDLYLTKWLSFRPQAGIRFAEIKQKYKAEYLSLFTDGVVSSFEETSFEALNKFDGLGLRIGSDIRWHLNSYISVVADGFFSLLYGNFRVDEFFDGFVFTPGLTPETIDFDREFHAVKVAVDGEVGLQAKKSFKNDKYAIKAGIFYQLAIWFDQNELLNEFLTPPTASGNVFVSTLPSGGDLQLNGWRFQLGFDF